jgi:hypothetical protein
MHAHGVRGGWAVQSALLSVGSSRVSTRIRQSEARGVPPAARAMRTSPSGQRRLTGYAFERMATGKRPADVVDAGVA